MRERAPNGHFVRDLLVFSSLRKGGYVAKGFQFEAPDLSNSPIEDLNAFQDALCLLLGSLHENQRLQVQYYCDSDYRAELLRYQAETERFPNLWTRRNRNERFLRYWQAMEDRQLRRQRVVLYLSRALDQVPRTFQSADARSRYYQSLLAELESEFQHTGRLLSEIFSGTGARVIPMTDLDHYRHYRRFLNPSLAERLTDDTDPDGFAPELSIQENAWHSEGVGLDGVGFHLDGHYHSVIALTRWPRTTHPGIIQRLTGLRLLDYTITVNVDPLPITGEISREEREHERVAGDYASEKKLSLLSAETECLVVLMLNTRRRIKGHYFVSIGTADTLLTHPREIFRLAIMVSASAIILAHNHPSGDPTPSEADIRVTRDIARAGQLLKLELLDHIILGNPRHISLRELGYLTL